MTREARPAEGPDQRASFYPKTILVVGRDYFFYTRAIVDTLRGHIGARADFIPIEPPGRWYNLARRWPRFASAFMDRYHRRAIAAASKSPAPDIVLFIQVHQLQHRLAWYRKAFPDARRILYYWDSLATHDYSAHIDDFDAVYTFDPADAEADKRLAYLPLFFTPEFREMRDKPPEWDLGFVGSIVHRHRHDRLLAIAEQAERSGIRFYHYMLVSPFFWAREWLAGRPLRQVHLRPMPRHKLVDVYRRSAAMLDIPNNAQNGFTMRTFETLGAHRRLVTAATRLHTLGLDDPAQVHVLDEGDKLPPPAWLRGSIPPGPAIDAFSLEQWTKTLLGVDEPGQHVQVATTVETVSRARTRTNSKGSL